MSKNKNEVLSPPSAEQTETEPTVLSDYGEFGKIEVIDLSSLTTEVDYLVYAQWK